MAKSRRVKRAYSSPLRNDQARATQRAIVEAASKLFAKSGYAAVSVDAIAAAAGVSRATLFNSVGGKPALIRAAYAAAFELAAGGEPGVPLVERPLSQKVFAEKTARGYIAGYAALATRIYGHLAQINEAVREAAPTDADVRALFDSAYAERRRGADRIVADVQKRGKLRAGLHPDEAADIVWVLNDPSVFYMFVHRREWSSARFEAWLVHALESELLGSAKSG